MSKRWEGFRLPYGVGAYQGPWSGESEPDLRAVIAKDGPELELYCQQPEPLLIYAPAAYYTAKDGYIFVRGKKAILGGIGTTVRKTSIRLDNADDVVISHIRSVKAPDDGITVKGTKRALIYRFTCQDFGDGAIDIVSAPRGGSAVSVDRCRLRGHKDWNSRTGRKCSLIGWSDADYDHLINVSIVETWFDKCIRRCPQINRANVYAQNNVVQFIHQGSEAYAGGLFYAQNCWYECMDDKKRRAMYNKSEGKQNGYVGDHSVDYDNCEKYTSGEAVAREGTEALRARLVSRLLPLNDTSYVRVLTNAGMAYKP